IWWWLTDATAIFSLLNAVVLRTLPVREPQQLLFLGKATWTGSSGFMPSGKTELFSYSSFRDFRRTNAVFSDVAAIGSVLYTSSGRLTSGATDTIDVELASGGYFSTLGLSTIAGRTPGDDDDGAPALRQE